MKKTLHLIEKIIGIYRWHPKIALRYLPVVDDISQNFQNNYSILEVGSGGLGIAPYIKRKIVGIDINFPSPNDKRLIAVNAKATDIPFADNSFDVVICMDVLEHNDIVDRLRIISEISRVATKKIYIGLPIGKLSEMQDKEIALQFSKTNKAGFLYLNEHLKYGLPESQWMIDNIYQEAQKMGKKVQITVKGNINLKFRKFLMNGWLSNNIIINLLFRKVFLLLIPVFRLFNQKPTYRELFFVTIN